MNRHMKKSEVKDQEWKNTATMKPSLFYSRTNTYFIRQQTTCLTIVGFRLIDTATTGWNNLPCLCGISNSSDDAGSVMNCPWWPKEGAVTLQGRSESSTDQHVDMVVWGQHIKVSAAGFLPSEQHDLLYFRCFILLSVSVLLLSGTFLPLGCD